MGKLKKCLCLLIAVVFLAAVVPTVALAQNPTQIYVSANAGSDQGAEKGTKGNPYTTLADAVKAINDMEGKEYTIYVMSNLTMDSMARIVDKDVTITSVDGTWTITRGANMASASDKARSWYNPAMIEVTTPNSKGASVTLTNITLDDQGRHTCVDTYGKTYGDIYAQVGVGAADHREYVQDAMVAAYGTDTAKAEINLNDGAVLKNYGGMSAVRVTGGALLTMNTGSKICDDVSENGTLTYAQDRVEKHNDGSSTGAAGAVWVQGTTAKLNTGSEISGVVGRAIYADGGSVTMNGSINNITGNANMWQGQDGVAVHIRGGSNVTQENGAVISNITIGGGSAVRVNVNSSFTMQELAKICYVSGGSGVSGVGNMQDEAKDNIKIDINGELCNIQNGQYNHFAQAINLNDSDDLLCTIGNTAKIHDNTVWYGSIYVQGSGIHIELKGKIYNNYSIDNTAGICMANNFSGHTVTMFEGAEITNNISKKDGTGVLVSCGSFIMKGGTISNNYSSEGDGAGVYVRRGGSFTMENGIISNNVSHGAGGGVAVITQKYGNTADCKVALQGGQIVGNLMNAQFSESNGTWTYSGGTDNDIAVLDVEQCHGNSNWFLTIGNQVTLDEDKIFFEKYNFSIKRPGEDVKFGNAATDCENAVKDAYGSKNLTEVVGSMWYQTDKDTLPLTVYDLTENGKYNKSKDLYAAVVDTNATGTTDAGAKVALYEVDVKANGSFEVNLPGGAEYGTAVVFLQEGEEPAKVVSLKPVDLTAYMGGDAGYDQVVIPGATEKPGSDTLPHPLFQLIGTNGEPMNNVSGKFTTSGKTWTLVNDGTGYYHFQEGDGQPPVRVTYTNDKTGATTLSDDFSLETVGDVFNTYTVALYTGEVDMSKVKASLEGQDYAVALGTGTLTVRAVENDDPTSSVKTTSPADPVAAGHATAVEPFIYAQH